MTYPAIPTEAVTHGEVFTRRWVVELILDLAAYTEDRDLTALQAVEPACGSGAFLEPMVERLCASAKQHGTELPPARECLQAFDLLLDNVELSRKTVARVLVEHGVDNRRALAWARECVHQDDYLLKEHESTTVDLVVGNPPYIRLEDIPAERYRDYRQASSCMTGRSDIYVGFFDIALTTLRPNGRVAFICADRWMRNDYGRLLRQRIAQGPFSMDVVVLMHDVDAFEESVAAYPAITILRRGDQATAITADTTAAFGASDAKALVAHIVEGSEAPLELDAVHAAALPGWFDDGSSWPTGSPELLAWLEELDATLPTIEGSGCRVGIGVATGRDGVYVVHQDALPEIEEDRLLPLAHAKDLKTGSYAWYGLYLIDPWGPDDSLVSLEEYPLLAAYLAGHKDEILGRKVARSQPARWWRTIDKVTHSLVDQPKLLFEDMKARAHPVLEPGGRYPHHNLYWVVPGNSGWDIESLGGLMMSRLVEEQVRAYCVKMRGGTLRFQAQYLRRVRIPNWESVDNAARHDLAQAFRDRDSGRATIASISAYGLDTSPRFLG